MSAEAPPLTTQLEVSTPSRRHEPALDGVRGIAIGLVLIHHFALPVITTSSPLLNAVMTTFRAGWIGVDLFFVLSGYLITGILLDTRSEPAFFQKFYARRVLRIMPLYYGILLALAILTLPLHLNWHGWAPLYFTYTANLHYSQPIPPEGVVGPFSLGHFWSLQVEEQFYLVWPFLVFFIRSWKKLVGIAAAFCLFALALRCYFIFFRPELYHSLGPYAFTPCRCDGLLIGATLAIFTRSRYRGLLPRLALPVFIACAGIMIIAGVMIGSLPYAGNGFVPTLGFSLLALTGASLIVLAQQGGILGWFCKLPMMRWLGRYSYGLYVFNSPIHIFLLPRIWERLTRVTGNSPLSYCIAGIVILAASALTAWLSFHLYEKHFLRLKRYFNY